MGDYRASQQLSKGRDPTVILRWLRETQRKNHDFAVTLDAKLTHSKKSLEAAADIGDVAPNILTPWGILRVDLAVDNVIATLGREALGGRR